MCVILNKNVESNVMWHQRCWSHITIEFFFSNILLLFSMSLQLFSKSQQFFSKFPIIQGFGACSSSSGLAAVKVSTDIAYLPNATPTICTLNSRRAGELLLSPAGWRIHTLIICPLIIVIEESKATRTGLHGPPPYLEKRMCLSTSFMPSNASCMHWDTRHIH